VAIEWGPKVIISIIIIRGASNPRDYNFILNLKNIYFFTKTLVVIQKLCSIIYILF